MKELFINHIFIKNIRHLKNVEIPLDAAERRHLILTGRNGSGKTSVLLQLKEHLKLIEEGKIHEIESSKTDLQSYTKNLSNIEADLSNSKLLTDSRRVELLKTKQIYLTGIQQKQVFLNKTDNLLGVQFSDIYALSEAYKNKKFVLAYFDAKRLSTFKKPTGPQKIDFQPNYNLETKINTQFVQYLVNMRYNKLDAKEMNDWAEAQKIDLWFDTFIKNLRNIFESDQLELVFDRSNYNFWIQMPNREKFDFNTLSDGYSAVMHILTELLLRIDNHNAQLYDIQGVVLIDEIETHLHIDLQKKILPFLTHFFPKIQFIITTHSPFVLTSLPNAVLYDLEKREPIQTDMTGYSVDAIIEDYFDSDKYSERVKSQITDYQRLMSKINLNPLEQTQLNQLEQYFKKLSYAFAPELEAQIRTIQLSKLTR